MRKYYQLLCQEQPGVSHQTPQKVLILVLGEWYYNCYMNPELVSKYNLWQVRSVLVSLELYQKSNVGQVSMYVQHKRKLCSKFHIFYDLVLVQNVNYNAYSNPWIHEALDVDHKMSMLGIGFYHNTFSHICVQHQHYPVYETSPISMRFWFREGSSTEGKENRHEGREEEESRASGSSGAEWSGASAEKWRRLHALTNNSPSEINCP